MVETQIIRHENYPPCLSYLLQGGLLLRMLADIVEEEVFHKGIKVRGYFIILFSRE